MYLSRLEIQGFKTFAKKTVLNFQAPNKNQHALTVIVGPNGSGKSNTADAVRWCLGEQSLKLLRGKKTEDIIFSGTNGKAKSGFAYVSITINNEDGAMPIEYKEIAITRRVYRDGDSEYLLNEKPVRLTDVQLLLAQAGVGQRSYSVVGQGMVDHVLTSSPEERKIFFDDATGVRGLQMKRHQALLKLQKAAEQLSEAELLLSEIAPRLRSLKRQVSRLEKREELERELRVIEKRYFGTLWWSFTDERADIIEALEEVKYQIQLKKTELEQGDASLLEMERQEIAVVRDESKNLAHEAYKKTQQLLIVARDTAFQKERELELAKIKTQSNWTPLPLHEIIKELDVILALDVSAAEKIVTLVKRLKNKLIRPETELEIDPELKKDLQKANEQIQIAQKAVSQAEKALDDANRQTSGDKTHIFAFQRRLRDIQAQLHTRESERNRMNIDLARVDTKIEDLTRQMNEELGPRAEYIRANRQKTLEKNTDSLRSTMLGLKHQLELIGAIDDETLKEYQETQNRFDFLDTQVTDIREAIKKTEHVIHELDRHIQQQSEKAFKAINEKFQKYFKVLFGGGSCELTKMKAGDESEIKVTLDRAMEELAEEKIEEDIESVNAIMKRVAKHKDNIVGIEINATPPGKRLKSLNLLSGGERALTSIALLSAIMATNPSPFVILDEVDAALDEANTIRFANILDDLRKLTQFIVITHNRATMERADLLYGVTMGDDGISNLVSIELTNIEVDAIVRR